MLADTSIWIDHFRHGNTPLASHLDCGNVAIHPFIVGELACGHLRRRAGILTLLSALPQVPLAAHEEVISLVEHEQLMGRGLGWVDVHLLASARLGRVELWTLDRRLAAAAEKLGVGYRA
jgi:predicted nucleic acid-binding protein